MQIELAAVETTLALFAEGIAGRYYHIAATSEFAGRRVRLEPGTSALTRDTLYLPERLDAPDATAFRVLALQQLAHREFGSYHFNVDEALRRLPHIDDDGAFDRAGAALPGIRASDFERFCLCFVEGPLANGILHLCERVRIDALIARHYPGGYRHLRRYHDHLIASSPVEPITELPSLLHALECVALGFDSRIAGTLDHTGLFNACAQELDAIANHPGDVYQSAAACAAIMTTLAPLFAQREDSLPLPLEEELGGPTGWMQREARLEDWREELAGLDRSIEGIELLDGDDPFAGEGEELGSGELRPEDRHLAALERERDTLARRIDMERSAIQDALGKEYPDARSYRYDEWDYLSRSYLRRWCRLFEIRLEPDLDLDLEPLMALMRHHRPRVQKQLELIRPLGYQRVRRVADGDELDFNAVIDARQDARAGQSPDERVYSRRDRVHRDVCAAFLVDLSASTDDPVDKGKSDGTPTASVDDDYPNLRDPFAPEDPPWQPEAAPRRIIDVQRDTMLILSAGLEGLGDSYGVYGFSGFGRDCVEFFVAKEPDERFSRATLAAIAGMKPKRSTRMGPAIRHATRKLIDSGSALKVLIILSDGFPQDSDYGPLRGSHEYGLQDTARALAEAGEKGIETFCLTVDKSGHDYLRRMCPDNRYMIIEDVEGLPEALSTVYRTLTA
ncbi:MAG: nitric oxide reductase activation protein NorD [Pseudomonadales bacterium]